MSHMKRLIEKLHPDNFTEMSPKMAAIVAFVLGETWTEPALSDVSITSDGFIIADGAFLGSVYDLQSNWTTLLLAADLTSGEQEYAQSLYDSHITDWRKVGIS